MSTYNGTTIKHMTYNGGKVKKWYHNGVRVFSAGSTVTYHVDSGNSYTEEVDSDETCLSPATFTPSKSGYTFVGWREDTSASGSVLSSKIMDSDPIHLYAVFRKTITLTLYNNSTTSTTTSGYQYYNNGNMVDPLLSAVQAVRSGWNGRGWSTGASATADIVYTSANLQNGIRFSADTTLYACYSKTVTITYYNGSATANTTSGASYYNSSGNTSYPYFTLTQTSLSGWTARGWSTGTAGNSGIVYNNGAKFGATGNLTLYGMYYQTITLSYNGNGSTSGSVAAQTGTRYYNSNGAVVNPSFVLAANGFAKTNYAFSGWNLGAAGTTITLSASTTAYAQWTGVPYTWVSNYYGSGETLSLSGYFTDVDDDDDYYNENFTRDRFWVHAYGSSGDSVLSFSTNTVSTRGLKYIVLSSQNTAFYKGSETGSNLGLFVYSGSGVLLGKFPDNIYSGMMPLKIDVSSASSVYLYCKGNSWYSTPPYCEIPEIKFTN